LNHGTVVVLPHSYLLTGNNPSGSSLRSSARVIARSAETYDPLLLAKGEFGPTSD
jgi:hypothetical protein